MFPAWAGFLRWVESRPLPPVADTALLLPAHPLAQMTLAVAEEEYQDERGEEGGNNIGPDLIRYGANGRNWCSAYVCFCIEEACRRLGASRPAWLPVRPDRLRARKVFAAIGKAGCFVTEPQPGDVMCLARGSNEAHGHLALVKTVVNGFVRTYDGNTGKAPAKVAIRTRDPRELTLVGTGFARMPLLLEAGR